MLLLSDNLPNKMLQHPPLAAGRACRVQYIEQQTVAIRFAGYPFDSVKVRLQASPPGTFSGAWQCFKHIVYSEGVRNASRDQGS